MISTTHKKGRRRKKKYKSAKLNKIIFIGTENDREKMIVVLPMVSPLGVRGCERMIFYFCYMKLFIETIRPFLWNSPFFLLPYLMYSKNKMRFYKYTFWGIIRYRLLCIWERTGEGWKKHHKNWCKRNFYFTENIDRSRLEWI